MLLMNPRQTRIFVPNASPYDGNDWYEQVLGEIVRPLLQKYEQELNWLWFTRYVLELGGGDDKDCDISKLTSDYLVNNVHRSVRLRVSIHDNYQNIVETNGQSLIQKAKCFISDWRPYDIINDLGGHRFIEDQSNKVIRERRAEKVVLFLYYNSRLILDCLKQPVQGAKWQFEYNTNGENPHHSMFESVHHLFCNMTAVPLATRVYQDNSQLRFATNWMQTSPNWKYITEIPLYY